MLHRRSFLKCTAAVGAVAALAPVLSALPRVVGDGVHNDWPGLQAALDGKPFIDVSGLVNITCDGEKTMHLGAGTFRISETLFNNAGMSICGAVDKTVLGPQTTLVIDVEATELLRIDPPYPRQITNLNLMRADSGWLNHSALVEIT
jgi:hypothetical protein